MSNDEGAKIDSSFLLSHFFWKGRPHFGNDDEAETDCNQEKREELAASETGDQAGVRFPEIFDNDAKDRVENKKQSSENTIRLPHSGSNKPENREQRHAFKE